MLTLGLELLKTQRHRQSEKIQNVSKIKEQDKTPENKQNGGKQSTRQRVQNTGYRILKKCNENSNKEIQAQTGHGNFLKASQKLRI